MINMVSSCIRYVDVLYPMYYYYHQSYRSPYSFLRRIRLSFVYANAYLVPKSVKW